MQNKDGFTLIELIVVILILGIISAIAAPNVVRYIEKSRESVCISSRTNIIRKYFVVKASNQDVTLEDILSNPDNIYFPKAVQCPSAGNYSVEDYAASGYSVNCSVHSDGESVSTLSTDFVFDFNLIKSIDNIPGGSLQVGDWEITSDGNKYTLHNTRNGENRILFKNENEEYSINTSVQLSSRTGNNSGNGYGIIFEASTTQEGNDSGYIFQLNKNSSSGMLSIRQRENGQDNDPILVLDPADVIPNFDSSWWDNSHDIEIRVSKINETTKTVAIFIDNQEITSTTNPSTLQVASVNATENYIGYRTWGNSQADIDSVSVSPL